MTRVVESLRAALLAAADDEASRFALRRFFWVFHGLRKEDVR